MWSKWGKKMVDVIYEDNHILVCIKPQNIPSQADSSKDMDMLTMVKDYIKEKYNKPGNAYVGLVHRLDRPTGGVMVFAKTSKAASRLSKQIQTKEFQKKYFAIVCGRPKFETDTLVHYLKKDEKENIVKIVPSSEQGAKKAELIYKTLETYNQQLSLVDVSLLTGRSHQIRVQMASIKTPLFGDSKYGGDIVKNQKLSLWAYNLSFVHPTTNQKMTFTVCPPVDNLPWKYFDKQIKQICN